MKAGKEIDTYHVQELENSIICSKCPSSLAGFLFSGEILEEKSYAGAAPTLRPQRPDSLCECPSKEGVAPKLAAKSRLAFPSRGHAGS